MECAFTSSFLFLTNKVHFFLLVKYLITNGKR
uniref:Uncharacterized protein n=1 Tax=Lepeophtheirus salmonis TaxID=72036 RepID=A0A0K2T4H5_LEPSM